jgi:hypothetical protein
MYGRISVNVITSTRNHKVIQVCFLPSVPDLFNASKQADNTFFVFFFLRMKCIKTMLNSFFLSVTDTVYVFSWFNAGLCRGSVVEVQCLPKQRKVRLVHMWYKCWKNWQQHNGNVRIFFSVNASSCVNYINLFLYSCIVKKNQTLHYIYSTQFNSYRRP